jgi:hypothetical protein
VEGVSVVAVCAYVCVGFWIFLCCRIEWKGGAMSATVVPAPMGLPVMGERARVACGLAVEGTKRRKLLVLLAAYADANGGACAPSTEALLERIPAIGNAGKLYGLVRRLADDGLVRQLPRGAGYELTFLDDVAGGVGNGGLS